MIHMATLWHCDRHIISRHVRSVKPPLQWREWLLVCVCVCVQWCHAHNQSVSRCVLSFHLSVRALCMCFYTFIMHLCVQQYIYSTETKQKVTGAFSCNLAFTKVVMWWVLTHICFSYCATSLYKSPCKSQSSDYNVGRVLIQTSVTNGCAQPDDKLLMSPLSQPYMACTMAWVTHSEEEFGQHYMVVCNEVQRTATGKLWNTQTNLTRKYFLDCKQERRSARERESDDERMQREEILLELSMVVV